MSMIPKGGDTIWGELDWSPEEGYECIEKKSKNNSTQVAECDRTRKSVNATHVKYGRIISFGKHVADLHSSEIERIDFRVMFLLELFIFTNHYPQGTILLLPFS